MGEARAPGRLRTRWRDLPRAWLRPCAAGLLVLAGMGLMALNTWKTFAMARSPAPQPLLPPDASEARA